MKKLTCAILALAMLCGAALAEGPLSVTIDDLLEETTGTWVSGDGIPADSGFFIEVLEEEQLREVLADEEELLHIWETEIEKLAEKRLTEQADYGEYFEQLVNSEGESVTLQELIDALPGAEGAQELGWTEPHVYEFWPIVAGGYDMDYGDVTADMLFATPYEPGQQVLVLIGLVSVSGDYTQEDTVEESPLTQFHKWYSEEVIWVAFPGEGVEREVDGKDEPVVCIEVTFTPEMVEVIQDEPTLVAIVSDEMPEEEENGAQ